MWGCGGFLLYILQVSEIIKRASGIAAALESVQKLIIKCAFGMVFFKGGVRTR